MVGREKLRLDELDEILRDHGQEGWELVTLVLDADIQGGRNGHLLVFKRAK